MTTRLSEANVQATILDALKTNGWRFVHFRPAKTEKGWRTPYTGHDGFPDVIALRGPQLLALELKGWRGKASAEQEAWVEAFRQVKYVAADVIGPAALDEALDVIRRAMR